MIPVNLAGDCQHLYESLGLGISNEYGFLP